MRRRDLKYDKLIGSGGGGGGGQDFTQTPDNLRSEDVFEGLLGLGQGRWKGLRKGFASLRINDTPMLNPDNTSNFGDWVSEFADGDPTQFPQVPTLVLGNASTPSSVNLALSNTTGTGVPVVHTLTNTGAAAVDLRFIVNTLYHQTEGGIYNETMHIKIRMKPNGTSNWINVLVDTTGSEPPPGGKSANGGRGLAANIAYYNGNARNDTGIVDGQLTITGKTTQPYVKEIRISVPNEGVYANVSWDIECTLMELETYDNDPVFDKRQVVWESVAAVYEDENFATDEEWRGLAWLTLHGTASDKISSQPQIWGDYDTKIIKVPPATVWNAATRQYTGTVWDGSWESQYTTCPAWIINDALEDPLAGISSVAIGSYLNKWDALELSKNCSELVPDGDLNQAYYVAGVANVLKTNVRVAMTTNVNIASPGTTLDQETMANNDRVLLAGQTTESQNGIYIFNGSASAMTRATDMDAAGEFLGATVYVTEGYTNEERWFKCFQAVTTLGTSPARFTSVHPRYSLNCHFTQPAKADEFIQNLAGAVGAIAWDNGNGEWRCKVDKIETPVAIFTEENIEGEFSYSHTDVDTRFNDITMAFRNKEFDFREDRVRVFDQTDIDARGRKPTSLAAIGCITRQEAYRRAMLRLRTSMNEFRLVTFVTNRQARFLEPFQTILVADKSLGYELPTGSTTNYIINGDGTSLTAWQGSSGTLNGGRIRVTNASPYDRIYQTLSGLTPGSTYRLTADMFVGTAANVKIFVDPNTPNQADLLTLNGAGTGNTGTFVAPSNGFVYVTLVVDDPTIGDYAEFDNVQVVEEISAGEGRNHTTGRLTTIDGPRTTVTLRDKMRLEPGATYKVKLTIPNPDYDPEPTGEPSHPDWNKPTIVIERDVSAISPRGDVTTIVLTSALPTSVPEYAALALHAAGLPTLPKTYRMTDIVPLDDGERVQVSAIEVDTGKYAAADNVSGAAIDAQVPDITVPPPLAPASGVLHLNSFPSLYGTNWILEVDWDRPASKYLKGYRVRYRLNDGPWIELGTTTNTRIEIQNPVWGVYDVEVYSIDRRNVESVPLTDSITLDEYNLTRLYGHLTNDSFSVPASSDGTVTSYTGASGTFKCYIGTVDVTADCTFAVQTNPQTLTASITNATGAYSVTGGLDAGEAGASITFRATHTPTGETFDKTFTIAKALQGIEGDYTDLKFKRSLSTPSTPTGDNPSGWSDEVPSGTDTLWMVSGTKTYAGTLIGAWSTPRILSARTFRGDYNSSTTYYQFNEVAYNGGTYMASQDNFSGQAPSGTAEATAYWDVVAAPGDAGAPGDPPSPFTATINLTSGAAVNLRTAADANGYTGASDATITFKVPNGVTCRGLAGFPGGYGIDTGTWPTGSYTIALTLIVENGGIVDGGGGSGGAGGAGGANDGGNGGSGGDAIYVRLNMTGGITIDSGGTVRGGGAGGGGGGGGAEDVAGEPMYCGGGGGGGGRPNGAAGAAGVGSAGHNGTAGTAGTTTTTGTGGGGHSTEGGDGGGGGSFAVAGSNGTSGADTSSGSYGSGAGGTGGAAGYAVRKNGYTVTVTNNGTMTGTAG